MSQDSTLRIEALLSDDRLVELCELRRIGDQVLDVISLSENQHSDILAWMFDAREGHGQGDQILRDLLIAASRAAAAAPSRLNSDSATARFFRLWPTSRLRTTGLGSTFVARELGLADSERVDLFVIDPHNGFVIAIENKAGTSHGDTQLEKYRKSFEARIAASKTLSGYAHAYIALDREFNDAQDDRPGQGHWLHLGYDWLRTAASRALLHVERGNTAASLVASYCHRQTDWENPLDAKCTALAAALHVDHPAATQALCEKTRTGRRLELEWFDATDDPHLVFALQNREAMRWLRQTRGMEVVRAHLRKQMPALPGANIRTTRERAFVCPVGWEPAPGKEPALNLVVWSAGDSKYDLRLRWGVDGEDLPVDPRLSALLDSQGRRFRNADSRMRRIVIDKSLSLSELVRRVAEWNTLLERRA